MNTQPEHIADPDHIVEAGQTAELEHAAQLEEVTELVIVSEPVNLESSGVVTEPEPLPEAEFVAVHEPVPEAEFVAVHEPVPEAEFVAVHEPVPEAEFVEVHEPVPEAEFVEVHEPVPEAEFVVVHESAPEAEFVEVHEPEIVIVPGQGGEPMKSKAPPSQSFFSRIKALNWLFILTVLIPTALSIVYFGFIASDVYISESRFVVRSPERQAASPLGMLLKGTGFARSQDDSYTVQDFMLSRDALKSLDEKQMIGKAFSNLDVDVFSRFAGLEWWDTSFEALHKYYQKKVEIQLDSLSSITTLTVRAFTAEDAYMVNKQLMEMSESLVNQLNELGRQDMIRFATSEVRNAEKAAKAAGLALSNYRNQKGVIDPERQSSLQFEQIAKLQDELIATQAQLIQLQTFTKSNPQIPSLQLRVQNLKNEIAIEVDRVAGGERSLAKKAAEYQRLALDREFADKQLGSTLASLELARNEAQRKQLYLERIVQPSKPDMAMEPRRIKGVMATFMLGIVIWGVLSMLLAGIREHQD
ncbi:MAG: hypothetical protein NTV43_12360 [Methylococcales bacterium]|nr:hypothetical protein [Methylococcales bacterium]